MRVRLREKVEGGGNYFAAPKEKLEFISSGCKLLDLALGGGWAERRIANIVGDKSTGKTLLCIEACVNFARKYPKGRIFYREAEAAFDADYAAALGMPLDRVEFGNEPLETVEDMFEDLSHLTGKLKVPGLYICDSLDALSDRAELERDIDAGSYGAGKAKKMSELLRRVKGKIAKSQMTMIIVSQVRDTMNVGPFTKKHGRSGGRALDFYASQVVELAQIKTIKRTVSKVERPTGIRVRAKITKNKISLPFREAEFEIVFGFGIDDEKASQDWLKEVGGRSDGNLENLVEQRWYEIEKSFLPAKPKYERAE